MATTKKPEIIDYIETGTLDDVLEIMDRLQYLPEFGMADLVRRVAGLGVAVRDAEIALSEARERFIGTARGLIENVIENWTQEEIQRATLIRETAAARAKERR